MHAAVVLLTYSVLLVVLALAWIYVVFAALSPVEFLPGARIAGVAVAVVGVLATPIFARRLVRFVSSRLRDWRRRLPCPGSS